MLPTNNIEAVFEQKRADMVAGQLRGRDVRDPRLLEAFRRVPRHVFVPESLREHAYEDRPLEIGCGQTISQPYIVAHMTQALSLRAGGTVLEIGTGSGYQTAILAELGQTVYSIERIPDLAERAESLLTRLGYPDLHFRMGDGTEGWPEAAPFDGILVAAAAPSVPVALVAQLAPGGAMVVPVGSESEQELLLLRSEDGLIKRKRLGGCRFVKLLGKEGWPNP